MRNFFRNHFVIGILHLCLAVFVINIGATLLYYSVKPLLLLIIRGSFVRSDAILAARFFPFQASLEFICSWYLVVRGGNFGSAFIARFVWIVPCVWWLLLFVGWHQQSVLAESRWQHFFWSRSPEAFRMQVVTTLPLITTLAYAFGNYFASKLLKHRCLIESE